MDSARRWSYSPLLGLQPRKSRIPVARRASRTRPPCRALRPAGPRAEHARDSATRRRHLGPRSRQCSRQQMSETLSSPGIQWVPGHVAFRDASSRGLPATRQSRLVLVATAATAVGLQGPATPRLRRKVISSPFATRALKSRNGHLLVRSTFGAQPVRAHMELTRDIFANCDPSVRGDFVLAFGTMDLLEHCQHQRPHHGDGQYTRHAHRSQEVRSDGRHDSGLQARHAQEQGPHAPARGPRRGHRRDRCRAVKGAEPIASSTKAPDDRPGRAGRKLPCPSWPRNAPARKRGQVERPERSEDGATP